MKSKNEKKKKYVSPFLAWFLIILNLAIVAGVIYYELVPLLINYLNNF